MSSILLEKSDKGHSENSTQHIRAQYFFIKDKIDSGNVLAKCYPTGEMVTDCFTKPLNCVVFKKFHAEI